MRVVLHADASAVIGTGHVTRCLALAAALQRMGADVTLASAQIVDDLKRRAAALGVPVVDRDAAPRQPDWLVVDGYHLGRAVRASLAEPTVPRLVIDDLGGDVADATMVVNQNLGAGPATMGAAEVEVLAGPGYALLAEEFAAAEPERPQPPRTERVLVTMGGADPANATALAVEALQLAPETAGSVRVILGPAHPSPDRIEHAARAAGFEVIRRAASLAGHLAWADLVVSACGTSVLECARLGRPIVGVVVADNQRRVARALVREGLGIVAGAHPGLTAADLASAIAKLEDDEPTRQRIARVGPSLVDGTGASRVARSMAIGPVTLRDATFDDAGQLLDWRNEPAARRASLDRNRIDPQVHGAWLRQRLQDPAHRIWIGQVGGEPIGVVRFALAGETAIISIALDPGRRGAGLGARLIAAGCARLAAAEDARVVEAVIRVDNQPSITAFRVAGFRSASALTGDDDSLVFRLPLVPME